MVRISRESLIVIRPAAHSRNDRLSVHTCVQKLRVYATKVQMHIYFIGDVL